MMFTAGLAADILFYSLCEWMIYAEDPHVQSLGETQDWAGSFPLFHWGPVPWGFYLALSVAFAFMIHVRKRNKQKYSEACRALLKQHTDGIPGRLIRPDCGLCADCRHGDHLCGLRPPALRRGLRHLLGQ